MPRISRKASFVFLFAAALFGALFIWKNSIEERQLVAACPDTTQYSYFSTPDAFDAGYREAKFRKADRGVKGLLVPHHLLAAPLIAEAFRAVETDRTVTVVLVSPNHFSAGDGRIITTAAAWRTPYGELASDCDGVARLAEKGAVSVEEAPFGKEHGISGVVPFIKKSLPNARVIPVIVKDNATDADLEAFDRALSEIFGKNMLVVGSFDFSHGLTDVAARFHDRKSLAVVRNLDDEGARALDIDSMPGLRLVMRHLGRIGARNFSLFAQANAAQLTDQPGMEDVTGYIAGAFSSGKKAADDAVTLLAFGDMMLARGVEASWKSKGPAYPFEAVPRLFIGSDIVSANAEGVFVDVPEEQKPKAPEDLHFPFEPGLLPVLRRLGFTHFGLANNHSLNFGTAALEASRVLMRAAGLEPFGDPTNKGEVADMAEVRGRKIAQIGYHQFSGRGPEDVLAAINAAKKEQAFVVVYPHWGVEYERFPSQSQKDLAHAFIDAGADVVLGSHPHVVQPVEVYKEKAIFYSLGNFVFDQPFSAETSRGLAVGITSEKEGTTFHLIPFDIRANQVVLMNFEERATLLRTLARDSAMTEDRKDAVASGVFTLKPSL